MRVEFDAAELAQSIVMVATSSSQMVTSRFMIQVHLTRVELLSQGEKAIFAKKCFG